MTRKRDYKREYAQYHGKPSQVARRAARNASRKKALSAGLITAGQEVDHKDGNPLNKSLSNFRASSAGAARKQGGNRRWRRKKNES